MPGTDIAVIDGGQYLSLNHDSSELAEILEDNLGGEQIGEADLPRVKMPAGGGTTWEIPGPFGSDSGKQLTGILVMAKRTRAYWPNPKVTGEPPVCKSADAKTGTGKQWATAKDPDPDGEPRTIACADCPMSQYGSHAERDGAQACSEKEVWFLLRESSLLPLVLALPATSLKAAKKYRLNLAAAGVKLTDVVTSVTLHAEKGTEGNYSVADFEVHERLDPDAASRARAYALQLKPSLEAAAAAVTAQGDQPTSAPKDEAAVPAGAETGDVIADRFAAAFDAEDITDQQAA